MNNNMDIDIDLFLLTLHASAKRYSKGGISGLARDLVMREKTLITKLDPGDCTHFPNISEFVRAQLKIVEHDQDYGAIESLCEMFGGQFVTRTDQCKSSVSEAVFSAVAKIGQLTELVNECIADGVLTTDEKAKIGRAFSVLKSEIHQAENTLKTVTKIA